MNTTMTDILPEYVENMFYDIKISKSAITKLRKRFVINKYGQCGTSSSGFEISGGTIRGKGKIWKTVLKILKED